MRGTNRTACPAHYLELKTLKASRGRWLLLRLYKSGFYRRVAGISTGLEP